MENPREKFINFITGLIRQGVHGIGLNEYQIHEELLKFIIKR